MCRISGTVRTKDKVLETNIMGLGFRDYNSVGLRFCQRSQITGKRAQGMGCFLLVRV